MLCTYVIKLEQKCFTVSLIRKRKISDYYLSLTLTRSSGDQNANEKKEERNVYSNVILGKKRENNEEH